MSSCKMASFSMTLFCILLLPYLAYSLSDKETQKLDEIEELLRRLENEINHIRVNDKNTVKPNPKQNETERNEGNETRIDENHDRNVTTDIIVIYNDTDNNDTTTAAWQSPATTSFDATTIPSPMETATDQTQQQQQQTTESEYPIDASGSGSADGPHEQTTEGEAVVTTGTRAEKDDDTNEYEEERNVEKEVKEREGEVNDRSNVRHLIEEGEDLERQLKGIFVQLRSLSGCSNVNKACGIKEGLSRCCKGLRCSSTWSGTCHPDCVEPSKSCAENFFCCEGYRCTKVVTKEGGEDFRCI